MRLQYPTPASAPVRAKRFADLGWAGGRDEKAPLLVTVDVGTDTTCVSTFPRGYENATSVLMPTAAAAGDPHAFRTLERKSFAVGSSALQKWPSDRVLRGSEGTIRLDSQIGLVEFPSQHVLGGLVAKAAEQHGRTAEQVLVVLPPFLTADRVAEIRETVADKSRLKLTGRQVPSFVAGAYFYWTPALRHALEKPATTDLEKWSLAALGEGRMLVLDWGASALSYGLVDVVVGDKKNELRLATAGAWPCLGGHVLTLAIMRDLKHQLTDAIVKQGPPALLGRFDKDRAKGDVWKPDFYDEALLELGRLIKRNEGDSPRAWTLRNMIFPTQWVFEPGEEPRGYAPLRKLAIDHARRLWEQAEAIKKTALGDPQKYAKESITWSALALKSRFCDHLKPDTLTYMPAAFLGQVHVDLVNAILSIDEAVWANGRKVPHVALMGSQASSRLLTDTLVQVSTQEGAKQRMKALVKCEIAPAAETALELKSVGTRGAALLARDEKDTTVAHLPEVLPFSIAIADCVGNIPIFDAGPIDELSLFQRRLHVDEGFPSFEFFLWESEDGTRSGAWGAIDFNKPEQWTQDDMTVRVDERFRFGKSGAALPRFRQWKQDASGLKKCFDRNPPASLDGRIRLRSWIPREEPDALKLLVFLESDLVTTFRKKVFLLEREFDPPPARFDFVYQRYYLSRSQQLIVTREWWSPVPGEPNKLRRNKTLHVCIGSTQAQGILGVEWGRL